MNDAPTTISGIILAAGYGERMLPLTAEIPKPLLPILGTPLLEILVGKLMRHGAAEIHCNLFHLSERIERFASDKSWPVRFHREKELLGTGGGIGNMAENLTGADVILLHNGDVLSDIRYDGAISRHRKRGALVTLILTPSGPAANVAVNADDEVIAIGGGAPGQSRGGRLLCYTGMAVLSHESLERFPRAERAGLVGILNRMIRTTPGSVIGWNAAAKEARWVWGDAGSPAGYLGIHRAILIERAGFDPVLAAPPFPLHVGEGATVDPGASWSGFCEIGRRATVERDAQLEDCVVLDDTVVARGSIHSSEILFPGGMLKVSGNP
jgi:NDP-sugar pyrophosphorylase family protein